jgi:hypothetical protein
MVTASNSRVHTHEGIASSRKPLRMLHFSLALALLSGLYCYYSIIIVGVGQADFSRYAQRMWCTWLLYITLYATSVYVK